MPSSPNKTFCSGRCNRAYLYRICLFSHVIGLTEISSDLSYKQNNGNSNSVLAEHSPDVVGGWDFFQNEKILLCAYSPRMVNCWWNLSGKTKLRVIFRPIYDLGVKKYRKTKVDSIWGWENYKRRDSFDVQIERKQSQALEHRPLTPITRERQKRRYYSTSYNTRLNLPTTNFDGNRVTRESLPLLHSTSSTLAFYFPVDINSGWPPKPVTHPPLTQTLEHFIFNSPIIQHRSKFLKLIHSYQYNYRTFYFSISHTFLYSPTQLLGHFVSFVCQYNC